MKRININKLVILFVIVSNLAFCIGVMAQNNTKNKNSIDLDFKNNAALNPQNSKSNPMDSTFKATAPSIPATDKKNIETNKTIINNTNNIANNTVYNPYYKEQTPVYPLAEICRTIANPTHQMPNKKTIKTWVASGDYYKNKENFSHKQCVIRSDGMVILVPNTCTTDWEYYKKCRYVIDAIGTGFVVNFLPAGFVRPKTPGKKYYTDSRGYTPEDLLENMKYQQSNDMGFWYATAANGYNSQEHNSPEAKQRAWSKAGFPLYDTNGCKLNDKGDFIGTKEEVRKCDVNLANNPEQNHSNINSTDKNISKKN